MQRSFNSNDHNHSITCRVTQKLSRKHKQHRAVCATTVGYSCYCCWWFELSEWFLANEWRLRDRPIKYLWDTVLTVYARQICAVIIRQTNYENRSEERGFPDPTLFIDPV